MKRTTTYLMAFCLLVTLAGCGDEKPAAPSSEGGPGPVPAPSAAGVPDTDISLFKGSVFDDPTPAGASFVNTMPGSNERLPPLFDGGPPRVPHGVTDFLPITTEENGCLECHASGDPEDGPQLPEDHKTDLRGAPDVVGDAVVGARWVCLLCHVPLSDAKPLPESAPGQ